MTGPAKLIFHLSDIHFGNEDREALDWVRAEIDRVRPDAIAITGDLTMRARRHEFAAAGEWINALPVPVTVEIGNHDLPNYHLPERYLTPYKRFEVFKGKVDREIDLPGLAIVPLNTSPPAQPRLNWSKGWISSKALKRCLVAIDALPRDTRALVAAHHPLRETGTRGTALTRGGSEALEQFAKRGVLGVISGHVHDPFDIMEPTGSGQVRMIGAGTLSERTRTTPPSFNELRWDGETLDVTVRTLENVATPRMMIDDVPEDADPPEPGDPVAPIGRDSSKG